MRSRLLLPAIALSSCGSGERLDAIRILGVERQNPAPAPELPLLRDRDPVALTIRIPRAHLAEVADNAGTIRFEVFRCEHPNRRYRTELYIDRTPIWTNPALLRGEAGAASEGPVYPLTVFVPRRLIDGGHHDCGRFANEWRGSTTAMSGTVRLPPS